MQELPSIDVTDIYFGILARSQGGSIFSFDKDLSSKTKCPKRQVECEVLWVNNTNNSLSKNESGYMH